MKIKFLIISKLVVFFFLLFTFSCQVEEDFITKINVNQSKLFSSNYISLDDFQRNKQFAFK
jgi:hypothetical protein